MQYDCAAAGHRSRRRHRLLLLDRSLQRQRHGAERPVQDVAVLWLHRVADFLRRVPRVLSNDLI